MGTCSCINSSAAKPEVELDLQRVKEISIIDLLKLAQKLKSNKHLFATLYRIQAKIRGLIIRNKVRSAQRVRKFMPNDSYNKFTTVNNSKIVHIRANLFRQRIK